MSGREAPWTAEELAVAMARQAVESLVGYSLESTALLVQETPSGRVVMALGYGPGAETILERMRPGGASDVYLPPVQLGRPPSRSGESPN